METKLSRHTRSTPLARRARWGLCIAGLMAAGVSQAADLQFIFTDAGGLTSVPVANCGPSCRSFTAGGVADDSPASGIPGNWNTSFAFTITRDSGNPLQGDLVGTFTFDDTSASNNDLSGTVSGIATLLPGSLTLGQATLSYTVTGGAGIFAGATGKGASQVFVDIPKTSLAEAGYFKVSLVPEPGAFAMAAFGLAVVGVAARRRSA